MTLTIKIIETETGAILTKADTDNMRLPFTRGWPAYGIFDSRGECLDSFHSYPQAVDFLTAINSSFALAA